MSHRVQLKDLRVGDKFRKYPDRRCPLLRIVAVRRVEFDPTSTDKLSIMMMLSGNIYTVERADGPGKPFEVTLDALEDVWTTRLSAFFWFVLWVVVLVGLVLVGVAVGA